MTESFPVAACYLREYGAEIIMIKGATPIPFKLLTITAGFIHMPLVPFVLASVVSRSISFMFVGVLFRLFGAPIKRFIDKYLGLVTAGFVVLLVGGVPRVTLLEAAASRRATSARPPRSTRASPDPPAAKPQNSHARRNACAALATLADLFVFASPRLCANQFPPHRAPRTALLSRFTADIARSSHTRKRCPRPLALWPPSCLTGLRRLSTTTASPTARVREAGTPTNRRRARRRRHLGRHTTADPRTFYLGVVDRAPTAPGAPGSSSAGRQRVRRALGHPRRPDARVRRERSLPSGRDLGRETFASCGSSAM
jgi:hypothetical protein